MQTETMQMTSYIACSIIEGFADFPVTSEDEIAAWSHLIETGVCWSLQGFYGKTAHQMIEAGIFSKTGEFLGYPE